MRKVVRVLIILLGMALGPLLVYTTFSILESVASYNIHNTWQPSMSY